MIACRSINGLFVHVPKETIRVFRKLLLPVGLCLSLIFGMLIPGAGVWLHERKAEFLFIGVIFLVNGYQTDIKSLIVSKRLLGAFAICGLVGYAGGALLGSGIARLLHLNSELAAGIVVMSTMAPTLSSVIVITQAANGNTAWSVLLTVGLNLLGVFAVPNLLALCLPGREVSVPVGPLLWNLILSVLLPFAAGIYARHIMKIRPSGAVNLLPTLLIITLSYMSFSTGRATLLASTLGSIALLVAALLSLHIVLMVIAQVVAVLFRYQPPERKAIVFISSQKTLPAAVGIVAKLGYTGAAAVPCVIYHFSQILFDSAIASFWRGREAPPALPKDEAKLCAASSR